MNKLWKRNAVVGAVLVLVVAAIVLNGRYAANVAETEEAGKVLGQATEVIAPESAAPATEAISEAVPSDYFATARLSRQQARDSALSLLQEAGAADEIDAQVAGEISQSIEALASNTMTEAQIENMVTAKGYDDCVVFLSNDSVSVVVSTQTDGLQTEDIAKITDIVKQETGLPVSAIKILEVN
ncbi:MAG: SpoIIIAH-like family protein [Oscillospiraceae bacterium]|nr:SpoIIIAH-like family protein [Oscillospiraceae bacterium]